MKIQKIKEKLDSRSNKKKELIDVINFSNKFLSIKSSGFNFDNQVRKEFEKLYSVLGIEKSLTRLFNGEKINIIEDKAALHWQTRDPKSNIYNDLIKKISNKYQDDYKIVTAPGPSEIEDSKEINAIALLDNGRALDISQLTSLWKSTY